LINGVSAGRKLAGAAAQNKASFDVVYQPGVIEVVGYTGGVETGRARLATAASPATLRITADRAVIAAGCGDLAYVTIEVQDQSGVPVKHGEPLISLEVSGAGELIALGSGNPLSEESYVGNQHKTYHGRLLAIVRSAAQAGVVRLTAQAEGLSAGTVELQVR
jgi:beta-galactosidase